MRGGVFVSAVCIIPARGGSRRIPRKNIRMFHGKPIIAYSIEAALASNVFMGVVVSTDDAEVAMWARWLGASVYKRSFDRGLRGTQEVTAEALCEMAYKYACCIYPTAPLMSVYDLCVGFGLLNRHKDPYTYAVGPDNQDAGQWYWGLSEAFVGGVPLSEGAKYQVASNRVCDINTEDDWKRAERMYAELHGLTC